MKKVTLPATPNLPDMQALAQKAAEEIASRIGVDGVFVLTLRASDDTMGCGISAPDIPFDCVVGCAVQMLGALRTQLSKAAKEGQ